MKTTIVLLTGLLAGSAQADGFICDAVHSDLRVKAFNHVNAEDGTRSGATMIVSNPTLQQGNKTIATFSDADGLLLSQSSKYVANVDLRFRNSSRKGELIGGTKLGQIDTITLEVDFTYAQPVENGDDLRGILTIDKRNGSVTELEMACVRYLKSE